jgi:uncharacterized protein (TIGR02996 family)
VDVGAALDFIADNFVVAVGYGLKRPMLRLHYRGRRFKLYLSAKGTVCMKTGALVPIVKNGIHATYHAPNPNHPEGCKGCTLDASKQGVLAYTQDPEGDEVYAGCLLRGRFLPARNDQTRQERPLLPVEREFLDRMSADPVGFVAECGRDMGRCCYCNMPLEDERSKVVGYGPTCAKRWGLPWGDPAYMEKAPSFAKAYGEKAHGLLSGVRSEPENELRWNVFADWLQENGLPRCEKPKGRPTLPRND